MISKFRVRKLCKMTLPVEMRRRKAVRMELRWVVINRWMEETRKVLRGGGVRCWWGPGGGLVDACEAECHHWINEVSLNDHRFIIVWAANIL